MGELSEDRRTAALIKRNTTHGLSKNKDFARTYRSWKRMRVRCYNKNIADYKDYGGRGIRVCKRWNSFPAFLKDMGRRPENTSLDRLNVNRNYCPSNCRWATDFEQSLSKRSTIKIKVGVDLIPLRYLTAAMKIDHSTVLQRIRLGFTPAEALHLKKSKRRIKICQTLLK